ncbi:MAG: hypothetical protein C5B47_00355 [Verrucomicrobia bacterium]|nr:MAG: hypothetical protein C5B47_00355 [Verrucomicrobiota bacterium]
MKIGANFDPAIGLASITVKKAEETQNLSLERSPSGGREALPLAVSNNFPAYGLQDFMLRSLVPPYLAQGTSLKDCLKRLCNRFSEDKRIKDSEFFSILSEECDKQEAVMTERQKQIGP